jgi:hypothetical protein
MKEYQERVITEHDDLISKIHKLKAFINGGIGSTYKALDQTEKDRMSAQLGVMQGYVYILAQRISAFQ